MLKVKQEVKQTKLHYVDKKMGEKMKRKQQNVKQKDEFKESAINVGFK